MKLPIDFLAGILVGVGCGGVGYAMFTTSGFPPNIAATVFTIGIVAATLLTKLLPVSTNPRLISLLSMLGAGALLIGPSLTHTPIHLMMASAALAIMIAVGTIAGMMRVVLDD